MWSYEFYLKCWYVRKLGTTAWAVIETNPECLQLSEQPALRVGRGNRPWFKPSDAFLWWDHGIPWPALSENTSLYSGLLCQTYWKFCRMPEFAEFLLVCPQESGQKDAVWVSRPRCFHSFSTNPCVPSHPASSPLLPLCYPFCLRAKQEFRELTFLGW